MASYLLPPNFVATMTITHIQHKHKKEWYVKLVNLIKYTKYNIYYLIIYIYINVCVCVYINSEFHSI